MLRRRTSSGLHSFDVKQPILSVSRLMDTGIETFIQIGNWNLLRFDGVTVEITRRGGLFVVQRQVVLPMLLAPVDDEPAGEALDLPPVDEEMERKVTGREEVPTPVAIEVPAPGERPVKSGNVIDIHTCHINLGATSASELVGEKTDMCHDHSSDQAHPSSNATAAS